MRVCWAQWVFMVIVAFMGLTQMLTACGNKGPLYLPTEQQQAEMQKQPLAKNEAEEDELDRIDAEAEQALKKDTAE